MTTYLFSSESVCAGHPDKLCDQISDAILDAFLAQDKESRVAVESFVKNNFVLVGGEISSNGKVDIKKITKNVIKEAGYDKEEYGFNADSCEVKVLISRQSPDISRGVNATATREQGAGDQGLMFGFATNETSNFMPLPIVLSQKITQKLDETRKNKNLGYLRPDGKCQVTVKYENDKPTRVHTVVLGAQHDDNVPYEKLREDLIEKVIKPVCDKWLDEKTTYHINATGKFVIGGPVADTGLTGRKIIVDTYGGYARHGGGCFSGKDPSKVDRSAAYAARYIAKNIVAAGLAHKCEIQIAYAIGIAEPVSLYVNCFNTNKIPDAKILELIKKNFPLKPHEIIQHLNLKRPIYRKTAVYGHFGRDDEDFRWERLDKVEILRTEAGF